MDWKYAMVMPNGSFFGGTKGRNGAKLKFCADCHNAVAEQDGMFFLPSKFRLNNGMAADKLASYVRVSNS